MFNVKRTREIECVHSYKIRTDAHCKFLPLETASVLRITIYWSDLGARKCFERHLDIGQEW